MLIKFAFHTELGEPVNMHTCHPGGAGQAGGMDQFMKFIEDSLEEDSCAPRCSCRASEFQCWLLPSSLGEIPLY